MTEEGAASPRRFAAPPVLVVLIVALVVTPLIGGVLMIRSGQHAMDDPVERGLIAVGLISLIAAALLAVWLVRILRRTEERLRSRLAEQDRLNTALEQFASRAAHDLRNPLATIRMAVDMLGREELSTSSRTALEIVERQSIRSLELIDGLLALAKATGTPRLALVDVARVVERVAEQTDVTAKVASEGMLIADPVGFHQIVSNLLENAARYGKTNGRAEVTVERIEQHDGWVVTFADRGPGVPSKEVARIFKPFERGENAQGVGTGLGLAIVGAVAQAHGGRAWYEAGADGGSVFHVFIPRPADRDAGATGERA